MLRKLFFLITLFSATHVVAQRSNAPVKTTEKPNDPQIDYTKIGAPMPALRCLVYRDTSSQLANIDSNAQKQTIVSETAGGNKKMRKKAQKHKKEAITGVNAGVTKKYLTNKDLNNGANLFVMMFNPTCSHCQEETIQMGRNDSLFKRSKVILVGDPRQAHFINTFIKSTHFEEYPFYLGIDSSDFIRKIYLYRSLPQINIYDKHRKLIKTYNGDVAVDSLKQYIQ